MLLKYSGTAGGLTGSPSITVTNITAAGNVSIAGTLTYEDVTNIDAVGVITARSGLQVTGGNVKVGANTLVTPSTDADNFIIDTGDVDSGISILSATTGRIYFGDAADNDVGSIRYVHTDNSMRFETDTAERLRIDSSIQIKYWIIFCSWNCWWF